MTTLLQFWIVTLYLFYAIMHFKQVECERILALAPVSGKSHWNFMKAILRVLTDHGHQVTVFTSFPDGNKENYTEIDLSNEIVPVGSVNIGLIQKSFTKPTDYIKFINTCSRNCCEKIYENEIAKKIVSDSRYNFDVIFTEIMASECVSYLSFKLNIPLVYITTPPIIISQIEYSVLGNYPNPAVVTHVLSSSGNVPSTFYQRFTNTVLSIFTSCLLQFEIWSAIKFDKKLFDRVETIKPSIVFSNSHYITDSRPTPPNVVRVGGIHLSAPKKIPDDILKFIENSPNGVIIFTLGSIITISSLPEHIKETIIEVLGQFPQRVLLKYEDEMINVPKNMMIKKWFPQRDILLHPNVKLFICHGGVSGVYEAVDAGVPVLGFPIFFDQPRNIQHLVDAGMAILMNLESVDKVNFSNAISELINNKKYFKNAKIASERFKDRPMSPRQSVDYWTRYVIRHKGAPHLKSHALNLTWYQYFLLDVILVLLFLIILVVFIARFILKFVIFRIK